MPANLVVFTTSGIWHKPPNLFAIEVQVRSGGGGGAAGVTQAIAASQRPGTGGGGGGIVQTPKRISAFELPETVAVTVGAGGVASGFSQLDGYFVSGKAGGDSSFGDLLTVRGGRGGAWRFDATTSNSTLGGEPGGFGIGVGGAGATRGNVGGSASAFPHHNLTGGGGGGSGAGYLSNGSYSTAKAGGQSGYMGSPGLSHPPLWEWCQSAGGGAGRNSPSDTGGAGPFPCGGGGGGAGGNPGGSGAPGGAGVVVVLEYLLDSEM